MPNESAKVSIDEFPSTAQEALAFLYVQIQDLSDKSPEDLSTMYLDAYAKISDKFKAIRAEQKQERRSRVFNLV